MRICGKLKDAGREMWGFTVQQQFSSTCASKEKGNSCTLFLHQRCSSRSSAATSKMDPSEETPQDSLAAARLHIQRLTEAGLSAEQLMACLIASYKDEGEWHQPVSRRTIHPDPVQQDLMTNT